MLQRHGKSRLVEVADVIALNVKQWDMKLMIAKMHCNDLNLDPEQGGEVRAKIRLKCDKLHVRCKCHGRGR